MQGRGLLTAGKEARSLGHPLHTIPWYRTVTKPQGGVRPSHLNRVRGRNMEGRVATSKPTPLLMLLLLGRDLDPPHPVAHLSHLADEETKA